MIFKKWDNLLLFSLIICHFFSKYNRAGVFNQSEIWNEHAPNFQKENACQISKNIEVEKTFRFGRAKAAKVRWNWKNWKNDSTILGSRMSLECIVLFRCAGQKLTFNGLNKPKQKVWYVR